jgi:hypothetical protein
MQVSRTRSGVPGPGVGVSNDKRQLENVRGCNGDGDPIAGSNGTATRLRSMATAMATTTLDGSDAKPRHASLTPTDLIFSSPTIASTHLSLTSLRPLSLPSRPSAQVIHAESAAEVAFALAFSRRRAYRIGARRAGDTGETEWA